MLRTTILPAIPAKHHFKIGEVSELLGVEPHVLRYWETEFKALAPDKTETKQRIYSKKDVELLLLIKELLYEEGYTIAGAKRRLKELSRQGIRSVDLYKPTLAELKQLVYELKTLVEEESY